MEYVYYVMSCFQDYIDFPGQVLAERMYQAIIVLPSIIGFFHGYFEQSFFVTFYWWLGGSILAALLCIPSWPFLFQRDKVEWQPSLEDEAASDTTANAASTTTSSSSSSSSTGAAAAASEVVAPNNKLEGKGSGKKR